MENKAGKKAFNPDFGHGYSDERFGTGAITIKITPEGLDSLIKNLQVGSILVVRQNRQTKYGAMHYFTEIAPPKKATGFVKRPGFKSAPVKAVPTDDLD